MLVAAVLAAAVATEARAVAVEIRDVQLTLPIGIGFLSHAYRHLVRRSPVGP